MAQLAVIGHGTDTGDPRAFLQIGVFPDGTTVSDLTHTDDSTDPPTVTTGPVFSNPPDETFTIRVEPTATADGVIALAKSTFAAMEAKVQADAAGLANLQAYIGQLIPAA